MSDSPTLTFDEFPAVSYAAWRDAAITALKGADFDKTLRTPTDEGVTLQPLYSADHSANLRLKDNLPGEFPYLRGAHRLPRAWLIAQGIPATDAASFNAALKHDLQRGQTAVILPRGFTPKDLPTALEGVDLLRYPVFVPPSAQAPAFLDALVAQYQHLYRLSGAVGDDPLGELARTGGIDPDARWDSMRALVERVTVAGAQAHAPRLKTIQIDTTVYHDAGATATQELAYLLATGAATIRAMLERGIEVDSIAYSIHLTLGIGGHFFIEIAKFRAARVLWAQMVHAFGASESACKVPLLARTGRTNKTLYDPYVNMLRTTTEALSGALAGVDALQVDPFDAVTGDPSEFSRRVARNQQIILQREVGLTRLMDPAGGSYAVEALTHELSLVAWKAFQQIEAEGGMMKALRLGIIHSDVDGMAKKRAESFAKRKTALIGTNVYPNGGEDRPKPAQASERIAVKDAPMTALSLRPVRFAEPFERLRRDAERYADANGHPPRVFLANLGALKQHQARADFAANFFAVGGFEIINPAGFSTPEEAAHAAQASGAEAVVLCSTDDDYPQSVPAFMTAFGAEIPVLLAGYPKAQIAAHKASGIAEFIYFGADCAALNAWLHGKIGAG